MYQTRTARIAVSSSGARRDKEHFTMPGAAESGGQHCTLFGLEQRVITCAGLCAKPYTRQLDNHYAIKRKLNTGIAVSTHGVYRCTCLHDS